MELHRTPRWPQAWWWLALPAHLAIAWLWWRHGWMAGLPALMALHGVLLWGTLSPNARLFGPVLSQLPPDADGVWLTIDDGPSDDTPALLDLLDAHGAKATFFLVGERAAARPALVREIAARGHGIANHSHTHPQARFWALGPSAMRREITGCQQQLQAITGAAPVWFRAVVGHANPFVSAPLRDLGLARVAWSARGYDAVDGDVQRVLGKIAADLAPGAIVLLHEGAKHGRSVEIVTGVLDRIRETGLRTLVPGVAEDGVAADGSPPQPSPARGGGS
ncbi:polysaccharide deacetylase family protein [Luteimonas aestuarii]|uniref:Polysaccharide deacetylase family protein n=1 Tax=Luteimonas aestuarii TaxID=453837 RepID=A0A4R5TJ59_9GAMM|nr:polysaccharide deacetylase family protein [Luteimonas aestuarii]TDK21090.1 polysaccharide deacetylase family protein [Luteimonas aestuarii]